MRVQGSLAGITFDFMTLSIMTLMLNVKQENFFTMIRTDAIWYETGTMAETLNRNVFILI